MTLYHLALRNDWTGAAEAGEYRVSTRGLSLEDVGFIHASHAGQVSATAERFYPDVRDELCVLVLDDAAIRAAGVGIEEEDAGTGELFPHIYGAIRPEWVTEVVDLGDWQPG
ncbi:MAG: DUF952 domain-containing protein [Corynebacterium sp.]|uniref:DUF952 domain-containing protein n=1 Tax=Corynebacterium sp. TaxID=1720 RepID=UPI003F9C4D60